MFHSKADRNSATVSYRKFDEKAYGTVQYYLQHAGSKQTFAVVDCFEVIGNLGSLISGPRNPTLLTLKNETDYETFHVSVVESKEVDLVPVETFLCRCVLISIDTHCFICEVDSNFEHN